MKRFLYVISALVVLSIAFYYLIGNDWLMQYPLVGTTVYHGFKWLYKATG